jgi:RNA polymerase sigma-70 factor (ECF subfamily)
MAKRSDPDIEQMYSRLLESAFRLTRSRADAEDLVHNAIERVYTSCDWNELRPRLLQTLYISMRNLHIDEVRRRRRRNFIPIDERFFASTESESPCVWRTVDVRDVDDAVSRLDETSKAMFQLRWHESWSYEQLSHRFGIPVQTVGTRLLRMRRRIRSMVLERSG